jgi:hypothetical protein
VNLRSNRSLPLGSVPNWILAGSDKDKPEGPVSPLTHYALRIPNLTPAL